jgi:hypothetical protein
MIDDDTPLLLAEAAKIAWPNGTVSGLTLRNAANRGDLSIERIGRRVYTTMADVREYRGRCRLRARDRDFGSSPPEPEDTSGSSRTTEDFAEARASVHLVAERLLSKPKTPLRDMSLKSARPRGLKDATPPAQRSRT